MVSSRKRKATDIDVQDVVREGGDKRKKGKKELITPLLLDTDSKW